MRARLEAIVLLLVGLPACTSGGPAREEADVQELLPALGGEGEGDEASTDDSDAFLRKSYGATSMRHHDCIQLFPDGNLVGENCPSGCLLWGPYLTTPSNADAHLTFELEATTKLVFATDVVSRAGKHQHGASDDRELTAGAKQRLGYRIHFFQPSDGVEGRLWIKGEQPMSFRIVDFRLEIQ